MPAPGLREASTRLLEVSYSKEPSDSKAPEFQPQAQKYPYPTRVALALEVLKSLSAEVDHTMIFQRKKGLNMPLHVSERTS